MDADKKLMVMGYVIIANQSIQLAVAFSVLAFLFTHVTVSTSELEARLVSHDKAIDRGYEQSNVMFQKQAELIKIVEELRVTSNK